MIGVRFDESWMLVPVVHVRHRDIGQSTRAECAARISNVLLVLGAAGIAALCGREDANDAPRALPREIRDDVAQKRMPVAHADVHRQRESSVSEPSLER